MGIRIPSECPEPIVAEGLSHTMYLVGTHRSIRQRARLSLHRGLGAGNFFWHVYETVDDLPRPILFRPSPAGPEGLSMQDLHVRVLRYASWYRQHGVKAGTRVGVYTADGLLGFLHHIAITSLGGVTVLANPNMAADVAGQYFLRTGALTVIGDEARLAEVSMYVEASTGDGRSLILTDVDTLEAHPAPVGARALSRHRHAPGDLVLISHSSGTTGVPKPTAFTHRGFWVGKRERLWSFPSTTEDRLLTALPHSHSSGLSYLSLALMLGLPTLMIDDPRGVAVAEGMNDFHPTVVLGFPSSLAALPIDRLSSTAKKAVHTWMGMGDASHERHIRPLISIGAQPDSTPGSTYVDGLGSSEMGMVLFKHAHTSNSPRFERIIGKPARVVSEAVVLDEQGRKLPDGQAGLLGVRTPSVTPGYVNDADLTEQARVNGYFLTGDIVRRASDGTWYHLDRVPDVISTVHGPVYSLPLEEVVLMETGALDVAVVAVADPNAPGKSRAVAVVLFDGDSTEPSLVLDICNAALHQRNLETLAAVVIAEDRSGLPVGVTGKVLKRVLRERHHDMLSLPPSPDTAVAAPIAAVTMRRADQGGLSCGV